MFILLLIPAFFTWLQVDERALEKSLAWLIGILGWLMELLLSPVVSLFERYLPDLGGFASAINEMFTVTSQYINWAMDATLVLSQTSINMIIAFYTLGFFVPLLAWVIKTPFRWYKVTK